MNRGTITMLTMYVNTLSIVAYVWPGVVVVGWYLFPMSVDQCKCP